QPVMCMHCEKAPCELVCPVGATVHTSEGLNAMVYNRCIGTRYCSNNCPYKVRRVNFFEFAQRAPHHPPGDKPERNGRRLGVVGKCTYCVQRIEAARIDAMKAKRRIGPNEIVPACGAACPTRAIVFGDLNAAQSDVVGLKNQPHDYSMLADLNTRPRT